MSGAAEREGRGRLPRAVRTTGNVVRPSFLASRVRKSQPAGTAHPGLPDGGRHLDTPLQLSEVETPTGV